MTNIELKEMIQDLVMDDDELDKIVVLEGDEFADGAIGITEDNRVVYSYDRLVSSLAKAYAEDGQSEEESEITAIDWLQYNTLRSLPYMESQGLLAPVIIYEFAR